MIARLLIRLGLRQPPKSTPPPRIPKIGETCWAIPDESPWPSKPQTLIKIIDVTGGWVRYQIGNLFPDERMPIERFIAIYQPFDKNPSRPAAGDNEG